MNKHIREILPESLFNTLLSLRGKRGPSPYKDFNRRHKAIFIHIPKTAGSSVSRTLGNDGSKHQELKYFQAFDPNSFNVYFKFAFVRNPYDRLVSAYHYVKQIDNDFDRAWASKYLEKVTSFADFVLKLNDKSYSKMVFKHLVFKPQHSFILDLNGNIGIDFIGRFERLENDFNFICKKLEIKNDLVFHNQSKHEPYKTYYTSKLADIVYRLYQDDFELLSYRKEL